MNRYNFDFDLLETVCSYSINILCCTKWRRGSLVMEVGVMRIMM
jgi:hypothetical protein